MMEDYYQKSMKAQQLAGMSQRTQECYVRSIRKLVDNFEKTRVILPVICARLQPDFCKDRKKKSQTGPQ